MDNLTNTKWVINNQPITGISDAFLLDFTSNSKSYHVIDPSVDGEIYYVNTTDPEHPDADTVYRDSLWADQAYRTIEISGGDDAADADAIAWFENNAIQKKSKHYALLSSWGRPNIQERQWLSQTTDDRDELIAEGKLLFGDEVYVIDNKKKYVIGADGQPYEKPGI